MKLWNYGQNGNLIHEHIDNNLWINDNDYINIYESNDNKKINTWTTKTTTLLQ